MKFAVALLAALTLLAAPLSAQIAINEANTVSADDFIGFDTAKPYEGFDFGILPHSGNNNSPIAPVNPGNPYPADIDASMAANQTSLPNGWTPSSGWARILGNGGDWIELVITSDHLDLRGWTLYWENDDIPGGGIGSNPDERGFVKFSNNALWSNLRAGTILTLGEKDAGSPDINAEIRDVYPFGPGGGPTHDTAHRYNFATDLTWNPSLNDWHIHVQVDEDLTDVGVDSPYFLAYSDIKVDNDAWRAVLFDSTNTIIHLDAENPAKTNAMLDLSTGRVGLFVGESAAGYGTMTGAGGINSEEVLASHLSYAPNGSSNNSWFEDTDFSTFGRENLFNTESEGGPHGVQNFSPLRSWLPSHVPGDTDGDGDVDVHDFINVKNSLDATSLSPGHIAGFADLDYDVDIDDLNLVKANFGYVSPPDLTLSGVVPEPASFALLVLSSLAVLRRRTR